MAFKVATIRAKAEVREIMRLVDEFLGGSRTATLTLEGSGPPVNITKDGKVRLHPAGTTSARFVKSRKGFKMEFRSPYPKAELSGFGKGSVDALYVTPKEIEVSLRNLPDVSIEVTD